MDEPRVAEEVERRGVYVGSTFLSFQVLGRHLGGGDSVERCGLARLLVSSGDS